ncbi:MAG: HAMP domain-containing protein [Clostridia bacterium]|nr:HAMP domain-containing protein [Clostridia bacterium]
MSDKHTWHVKQPYSYRSKIVLWLLLLSVLGALIAFAFSYLLSSFDVQGEIITTQTNAALAMIELEEKTDLPLTTIIEMTASRLHSVTLVTDATVQLTEDELQLLNTQQILTISHNILSLPVTYVNLKLGVVRIMPSASTSISVVAALRVLFSCISFLTVFGLGGLLIAHILSRPITRLTKATAQVAEGDFDVRLPENRTGEIGTLMRSFNSMAEKLGKTAYLQKDFISSISHEFKTPIASIRGYAKLLQMPGLDEDTRADYVDMIAKESDRLARLSQTLLRLTSLEQQVAPASLSTFRLDEQLREVIVHLAPAWESKDIDWQLELSPVTVTSDEELLRQVWVNLIQNAVKFSHQGGVIRINVLDLDGAVVDVIDHGVGMDDKTLERIFDRFYQADASRANEGVGLGLCLVKRIADMLGGTVSVHSQLGSGSTFRVRLPKDPRHHVHEGGHHADHSQR